ncbi:MAG TPA: helix-turn-helix transcriptional regulator [Pseudonocardiaceae bacterium]|nr:helix-turn-helix transcriptional regulator [Pseudonocardiaceae bacterium]
MDVEDGHVGRRVREVRNWRGLSVTATAGLAGMSASYLSLIERGLRPVTKRSVLEALASALKVSPTELTGQPYPLSDLFAADSHFQMAALADALTGWWVGETPDGPARPWGQVAADVDRVKTILRPRADYVEQAALLPQLIRDLLSASAGDPDHRQVALVGLIDCYHAATNVASHLGLPGLPTVAVERMRQASELLDDPAYTSFAGWARAHALSGTNRARQYQLAVNVADNSAATPEVRGMANLTAALACAAQNQNDTAETHLDEAAGFAEQIEPDVSEWGDMQFGRTNVGIWRVAIGVELGKGGKVAEIAAKVRPETISRSRQSGFWIDYGRGLLADRKSRDRGLAALLHAETLAPQQVRNNVFVRESVANLLTGARRDAGGRELRGLAWRLGIAPTG